MQAMRFGNGATSEIDMIHFALDFGNSRVKCYAQGPQLLGAFAYSTSDWDVALIAIIKEHAQGKEYIIGISSVNPGMDQQFSSSLELSACTMIRTKSLLIESGSIDFSNISGMGEDRMHGLYGALQITQSPLITIDCGTAITFNVLNEQSVCLGGAIMPGFTTMYGTLSSQTAGLPLLAPQPTTHITGISTQDAIHAGISSAISGAISKFIEAYPDYEFLVLGGDAESIMAIMENKPHKQIQYVPDCIAHGIFAALALKS